jgi:hypothetical protein
MGDQLTAKMIDLLTFTAGCANATSYVGTDYYRTADALERRGLAEASYRHQLRREVRLTEDGKRRAASREHEDGER